MDELESCTAEDGVISRFFFFFRVGIFFMLAGLICGIRLFIRIVVSKGLVRFCFYFYLRFLVFLKFIIFRVY